MKTIVTLCNGETKTFDGDKLSSIDGENNLVITEKGTGETVAMFHRNVWDYIIIEDECL